MRWYALCGGVDSGMPVVELWHSEGILGEWSIHPQSRHLRSRRYGQPAGAVVQHEGRVYAPIMDMLPHEGDQV